MLELEEAVQDLKEFAADRNVRIRFVKWTEKHRDCGYLACYYHHSRTVTVLTGTGLELDEEASVYVIAHEIGHSIDWDRLPPKKSLNFYRELMIVDALRKLDQRIPESCINYTLCREKAAFREADRLLKKLGIHIPYKKRQQISKSALWAHESNMRESGKD